MLSIHCSQAYDATAHATANKVTQASPTSKYKGNEYLFKNLSREATNIKLTDIGTKVQALPNAMEKGRERKREHYLRLLKVMTNKDCKWSGSQHS